MKTIDKIQDKEIQELIEDKAQQKISTYIDINKEAIEMPILEMIKQMSPIKDNGMLYLENNQPVEVIVTRIDRDKFGNSVAKGYIPALKKGFWSKARMFVNYFSYPTRLDKYCLVVRKDKPNKNYACFEFQQLVYKNQVVDTMDRLVQQSLDGNVNLIDNVSQY